MGREHFAAFAQPRIDPVRTPFHRTAAYQRYGFRADHDPLDPEHLYTKALIEEQGFDAWPHVVSTDELDAFIASGEIELFRGIARPLASQYAEQLRSGRMWVGRGGKGGGIYAAVGPDARDHAAEYAADPGDVVVRMALRRGARLVATDALDELLQGRYARALPPGAPPSLLGAYLGYDGIVDAEKGVALVRIRTALRVQREDVSR